MKMVDQVLDIGMAVNEMHSLSSKEIKKLVRGNNFKLRFGTGRGNFIRVDMERLAGSLPLHLLACAATSIAQPRFRYLLRGVRLLHSLGDLASSCPRLEQILLQEVKIREQVIDLVIFLFITSASVEQDGRIGSLLALLHSTLVACCFHLLTAFITPEWRDVVPVLLAHPKVDVFMDVAFDAVKKDIGLLQGKMKSLNAKISRQTATLVAAERVIQTAMEQCEASLQVLVSLCEPQQFRERLLSHEEVCRKGGILQLSLSVLQLYLPSAFQDSGTLLAAVSRMKSKALAMLLKFCETETVSFLDEVAADPRSMHLAQRIAGEIVALVKCALMKKHEYNGDGNPHGPLYLNSMRVADVLSDDSNFRSLLMDCIAPDLAVLLAMEPAEFASRWCGGPLAINLASWEIDALLVYDPFHAAGAAMTTAKGGRARASEELRAGCSLSVEPMDRTLYAKELSSLLVKLFANLHCFNPDVCSVEEKDRFIRLFIHCLSAGPLNPNSSFFFLTQGQTAVRVCENLYALVDHVATFSSQVVNDEDVQLVSLFSGQLHEVMCPFRDALEPPAMKDIKDAHEHKLQNILASRQWLERWQRLKKHAELSGNEECNSDYSGDRSHHPMAIPEEAGSAIISDCPVKVDTEAEAQQSKSGNFETVDLEFLKKGEVEDEKPPEIDQSRGGT